MWIKALVKIGIAAGAILAADGLLAGQVETAVNAIIAALAVLVKAPRQNDPPTIEPSRLSSLN